MRATTSGLFLGIWMIAGCGSYEPAAPKPAPPGSEPQAAAKPAAAPATPVAPSRAPAQSGMTANMTAAAGAAGMAPLDLAVGGPSAVQPAGPPRTAPAMQSAPQPGAAVQKADVGVGKRGRGYGGGLVTTPVATYFAAKEMIAFRIQIPDALRLYKAENGTGPKTHEEFMEKIIKANSIRLPELPPGQRYVYLPDREELCVEHPE